MRDLELRGAGNLLGEEQSGHVAALGFELYMQMLDEAVQEASAAAAGAGGSEDEWEPVRLDINVDAYVPASYIPYEQAKVDVHRRIAGAREVARTSPSCATRAGRPLRRAAGAAGEPAAAADGADQARTGRCQRRVAARRPAGGDGDRAQLAPGQGIARRASGSAVRVRALAASRYGFRPTPDSSSRRSCGLPMRCSRCFRSPSRRSRLRPEWAWPWRSRSLSRGSRRPRPSQRQAREPTGIGPKQELRKEGRAGRPQRAAVATIAPRCGSPRNSRRSAPFLL